MDKGKEIEKIKVFSSDDEKLKILGELLSNKSSRDIIKLLIENEMYVNEIAKKLELRPNLVIHHLQKMKSIGLLEVTNKKIIRKGEDHRYFKMMPGFLVLPTIPEDKNKESVFKKFIKNVKYAGMVIATYSSIILYENNFEGRTHGGVMDFDTDITNSVMLPIIGIILGTSLFIILKKKKG